MSKRRGKRVVVGYVVSHTGKRGGPLVRYELDAEEERLRDAVVASADAWEVPR